MYLQVNLDFNTREVISQSLQRPSPSCFVVAQRKIYSLMENGSFPRFIQSEQYQVLFHAGSSGLGKHRKAFKMKCTGDLIQPDSKSIILSRAHKDWHHACWCCEVLHRHRPRNCWQTLWWYFPFPHLNTQRLTRLKAVTMQWTYNIMQVVPSGAH